MSRQPHTTRGSDALLYVALVAIALAGFGIFLAEFYGNSASRELTRLHREACIEEGRRPTECCRVDGAMICPLEGVRP